jgi:predicted regulator of Ras-like GTPase activity (Roadblock/LC7/MglB family)
MNAAIPEVNTAFGRILKAMVDHVPGALGAVFADSEGEPVDQFAYVPPLDIQILGAQWGLVLSQSAKAIARMRGGAIEELWIEAQEAWVLVRCVTDGYFVVLALRHDDTHLATALRELAETAERLKGEM